MLGDPLRTGHVLVLLFVGAVLAAQVMAAWLHPNFTLWPFLQYDMYSGAAFEGSEHYEQEIRAVRSSDLRATEVVRGDDVRIRAYVLKQLMRRALKAQGEGESSAAREILTDSVQRWLGPEVIALQLWQRGYRLERNGLREIDREMRPIATLHLDAQGAEPR